MAGEAAVVAAAPVRALAREVLARLADDSDGDLATVLDAEPVERWPAVLREEMLRLGDVSAAERHEVVRGVFDSLLTRPGASYDLAASMLHVLLELPPALFGDMVVAVVHATGGRAEEDAQRLRAVVGSALARFPVPQWQRLAASFNQAATAVGEPAVWR